MTARYEEPWTLNEVVAYNIKELRLDRRWSATLLAERLTDILAHDYTRFTVADLEGRREREIRWVELVALCSIFDVPLWKLVLPPEGVEVDTPAVTGDMTGVEFEVPFTKGMVGYQYPDRDALSWRLFSLDSENLESKLQLLADTRNDKRKEAEFLALLDAVIPKLFQEFIEREGSGE